MVDQVAAECGSAIAVLNLTAGASDEQPTDSGSAPGCPAIGGDDTRGGFTDVDRDPIPRRFVGILDAIAAMDFVPVYKRRTHDVLGIRPGHVLLDVGCGTGEDALELARLAGPGGRAVGIDRSETVVAEARRRARQTALTAEFAVGDACALDFADASFDGCRVDRVLHHLDDPGRAVAELVRVARPGARVVAFEPDFETALVDGAAPCLTRRLMNHFCDGFRQGWMGRRVPALFREAGLREVAVEPVTVLLTDYAQGNTILALEGTVARAADAGLVTPEEGSAWLARLRAASQAGRFFGAITCFLVHGQKPC
jgi:ubiquinone/menaquinone biosynthesis C-methylase UbiE